MGGGNDGTVSEKKCPRAVGDSLTGGSHTACSDIVSGTSNVLHRASRSYSGFGSLGWSLSGAVRIRFRGGAGSCSMTTADGLCVGWWGHVGCVEGMKIAHKVFPTFRLFFLFRFVK